MLALIFSVISTMMIVSNQDVLFPIIQGVNEVFTYAEKQKYYDEMKIMLVEELTKKYGDGDFEVVSISELEERSGWAWANVIVKSSYVKENFNAVTYSSSYVREAYGYLDNILLSDDFIEIYAKEKWNVEDIKTFAIEKTIEKEKEKIPKEYDIKFNYENTTFDEFYEYEKGREPIIEDLMEMVNIKVENDVIVGTSYTKNDLEKFSAHMCDICKIYIENYARDEWDDAVWFEFENGVNPYQDPEEDKLGAYKDGGYVKDAGPYWTLLYLNPKPLDIRKMKI